MYKNKNEELNKEQQYKYNKAMKKSLEGKQINKYLPTEKKEKKKDLEKIFIKK